ncbi:hypothetical protein OsI_28172 [Oryza sativa Indica Group]|uniref:Uncharacterized protein n=1 Tax=Oryza sativa subsp. indica TaxID=39946 RepID=A2YS73_ORYSI|nr:hypothetical protein OsI_28172 [Oryza sativa Indica Group]
MGTAEATREKVSRRKIPPRSLPASLGGNDTAATTREEVIGPRREEEGGATAAAAPAARGLPDVPLPHTESQLRRLITDADLSASSHHPQNLI